MKNALIICFSPTGSTYKLCSGMINQMSTDYNITLLDITPPNTRKNSTNTFFSGEVLFIAAPVYSHGGAKIAVDFIKKANLNFDKAVVICTYGCISCGSAVYELAKIIEKKGIPVIAAAEVPMMNSYATLSVNTKEFSVISEPDYKGFLRDFLQIVCKKAQTKTTSIKLNRGFYSGNLLPQKAIARLASYVPKANEGLCTSCMRCIEVCPSGAIISPLKTYKKDCFGCAACVKCCSSGARKLVFRSFFPKLYLKQGLKRAVKQNISPRFFV